MGFSIVTPFLVFLVTRWGGNALIYGLMGATYSFFQLIGAPVLGRWSDRFGRRKILLLSQAGTLVSWLIFLVAFLVPANTLALVNSGFLGSFALTLPLIILFIARAADGITGGNVSVANAYLADITEDKDRSKNFGRMAVSGNLGYVFGPAVAGILGATVYGELLPVLAATLISVIATLLIAFTLHDIDPCRIKQSLHAGSVQKTIGQEHKECYKFSGEQQSSFSTIFNLRDVPALLVVYFLVMLSFSFFYIGFPIHVAGKLSWTVSETGMFFAFLSLAMVIVQGPVLQRLSQYTSDPVLVICGTLLLAAGFAGLTMSGRPEIYAAAILIALGNGIMWPSAMAMLSKAAEGPHQGMVQGTAGSVGAVASIIGLIAAGVMYTTLSNRIFVVAALLVLPVVVLAPRSSGQRQ